MNQAGRPSGATSATGAGELADHGRDPLANVFAAEWAPLVARLVRDVGDVGLAEDAAQEAFVEAARRWSSEGTPDRPGAWLLTTARRKAIDGLRRSESLRRRLDELVEREQRRLDEERSQPHPELGGQGGAAAASAIVESGVGGSLSGGPRGALGAARGGIGDDQLALLLGCCHPALSPEAQVALTLRIVGGLSSAQIARAFFVSESTMVRRISRAKAKIRATNIGFGRANLACLADRLPAVTGVIYSIFTEGHSSTDASTLLRGDLCDEAIWLATLLHEFLPHDPEVAGLLALMLLIDARRAGRVDLLGRSVPLSEQDRAGWDAEQIAQGLRTLARAHSAGRGGPYQFQAGIAALHATAPTYEETDWSGIIRLYDVMLRREPSALLALNRAIAVFRRDGATAGIAAVDAIGERGLEDLTGYPYLHSALGEMYLEAGQTAEAVAAFDAAIERTGNGVEVDHLRRRRRSAGAAGAAGVRPSGEDEDSGPDD